MFILVVLVGLVAADPTWASDLHGQRAPLSDSSPETSVTCDGTGIHTARLYRTLFGRRADREGQAYWVGLRRAGLTGEKVAYWMTRGAEYHFTYQDLDDDEFIRAVYHNVLGREADAGGHAYWPELVPSEGRHSVVRWMTQTPEFATRWPLVHSSICSNADPLDLSDITTGITVSKSGSTVTVQADRGLVDFSAVDGGRTHASAIGGDVVVNANWFIGSTSQAPVVSNGHLSGSGDIIERGQILSYGEGCDGHDEGELDHIWMGEIYRPEPCVETAVSGVSLVHKGVRSDAYPGIDITHGYTNTSRSHSFIGFNQSEIVIISTRSMNASQLADYAISLAVTEGIMLDGGGSTQIKTPSVGLWADRSVTAFAVLNSINS
ncbi:MAG: DUF4214 domain-containing protein [Actinomycetia bacterium]|nr:DUF4214 domain-containing protein [Actinomycetes bacterium]